MRMEKVGRKDRDLKGLNCPGKGAIAQNRGVA
jgi:hypothetical protein